MTDLLVNIAVGMIATSVIFCFAALTITFMMAFVRGVLGKPRSADVAAEAEDSAASSEMTDALSVILEHGDTMHTCQECESTQTTLERVGYRYSPGAGCMVVIVHEKCNDCDNEVTYLMTSIGWVCAVAHTEWGMWMLAQDSSNVHMDITQDLSQLDDESGLDGPPVGG